MNVIFTFYRNFIWPASFVSLLSGYLVLQGGSGAIAVYMFWMKLFTSFFLGVFFNFFQTKQLYFFHNLGYSKTRLYRGAATLDFSIWLALIMIAISLKRWLTH